MDNSYSLSSEDKQTWKDLFGPGSLREDLRQSTVDRIVERVIPLLTLKSLRVGKLIPFLEKRNVIAPDSLANLKMDTKQVDSICDLISANQTPHTLFCLYASLSESGKEVPIHDQLACDIRDIIQSECVEDDSVGGLQERGAVRSQSSAQATWSPNNTQEMSEQRSGVFCVLSAEATRTPNPTGDQGSSNSTGDTNASREHHLADGIPTPLPSCKGSHPRQFVSREFQSECVVDDSVGGLQERGAVRSQSSAQATRSPNNTQEMAVQSECVEDDSVGGLQERGAVRSQSSAQATWSPNNTQEMSEQKSGVFCVLPAEATRTPNPTGDQGSSNSTGDTNASREHHLADGIPTPLPSCKGSHPRQFVPGSVRPEDKQTVQSECVEDDSVGRLQERGAVRSQSSAQATRSPNNTQEMAEQKSGVFCVLPAEATRTPNPTGDQGSSNSTGDTNASREHHLADGILTPLTSCKGSHPRQFVLGSVRPALSLSSPDSTSSGSLKNSLSSVMENAVPLSQANDFGTSISQNDLIAPSSATSPPIELCDRNLLAEFNNPNESDVFALLVQTGASVNLPTNHERSYFLHLAIGGVMFDKVQVLLQYGADTNVAREDGRTPLHLACEQQLIELVRLLVEHGANVNAVDNCGMTCLHLMNTLEEPDIVNYLIQQGAQLHVDVPTKDGFNTPLTIATGLLKETAKRTVSLLLQAGASANGHPQSAVRPLVAAASRGHVDTVELLLSAGANVNLANKDGTTALMAAVLDNHQNIVQLLLDKGADLSSVRSGPYSVSGNITSMSSTALSDAAYLGNLPLVKLLKEKGAKLTAGSQEEKAPIVFAAMGGDVQVVDYIVTNGEIPENELLEAFEAALKHRHDNCAVVLLNSSKGKDKMREAAMQHCTGERLEKMFKSIGAGAVQGPSSSSQMSGPDSHLFQAVQALPPARRQPARSRSMYRSGDDDHHLMSEGLGQEAHKLIEILHEFAQVCLQAALNNRSCDWLIDHAKRCHHSQLVDFFTSYYTHGATSVGQASSRVGQAYMTQCDRTSLLMMLSWKLNRHDKKMSTASIRYGNCRILDQIDPSKFVADFFHGEPSVLTFLIQRNIISKARVQEVLNDMGRNSVDFFTELMEAFHHIPGTDHLPYDGDLVANHLFDGTIVIGKYYKPSSELFSTDSSERQSTMPTTGGHRLGGSAPPANMRDLYSQQTSQHSSQQARQQIPSPGLGLSLDPNEHQMAIKWWLGLNTSPGSPPCALCPEHPLDPLSHHAVTCKRGGDAISRHNKLRDVVLQTYHRACISAKAEAGSGLGHELWNTRPADILASNWLCGKPAAFDLTVVSPLNPTFISEAGRTAGSAAVAAELWKHSANDAKCSELGWTCIPLVAESYGAWGSEAVLAFSRLASYLATRTNSPKSKPPSGESGSRAPAGSSISSTPLHYGSGAMQALPGMGQSTVSSGSSPSSSCNENVKNNLLCNKIGPHNQMARSQPQLLESGHHYISVADTVALSSTERMNASVSQSTPPVVESPSSTTAVVLPPGIQQFHQQTSGLKPQSELLSCAQAQTSELLPRPLRNEALSQTQTPSNEILSQTQSPENELLSLTPSESLPQTQPPRNGSERTVSTGDEGTPEVIQSGTVPSEHAAASPKPKHPSVTAAWDKPFHSADGRQKQDRTKASPLLTATRAKDEISRVGKNVSKPAVTAPGPSSHRVLQASNAPSAFHRPLKPKGTPVAATLETKPRGKIKSPAKTTAIAEEHANDGGEEKAEEVGRDNARDKKMENSINGHRSGIENAEENKSEVSTDFVCQNQVGLGTGRAAFPGGISTEQSRSFVVHIDIPDGTSGSAHMDELSARFEAARTQCMCTHAHVTLKYESTRDGPGQLPDSTFMAPLSQCHMLICALCTYMKCSSVLVSANFFVF
eukprot:Em0002g896a